MAYVNYNLQQIGEKAGKRDNKGVIKLLKSMDARTLQRNLDKADHIAKVNIASVLIRQVNWQAGGLIAKGMDTPATIRIEKHADTYDLRKSDLYMLSDAELERHILEAQHTAKMQTLTVYGELKRRETSIAGLAAKGSQFGTRKQLEAAMGWDKQSGQFSEEFFRILSRAYEEDEVKGYYYAEGTGGFFGQLVKAYSNRTANMSWSDIIEDAKKRFGARSGYVVDDEDDFNN